MTDVLGYAPQGRPLSVTDPNEVVTDYEYPPRGWLAATQVRGANDASEADDRNYPDHPRAHRVAQTG